MPTRYKIRNVEYLSSRWDTTNLPYRRTPPEFEYDLYSAAMSEVDFVEVTREVLLAPAYEAADVEEAAGKAMETATRILSHERDPTGNSTIEVEPRYLATPKGHETVGWAYVRESKDRKPWAFGSAGAQSYVCIRVLFSENAYV